MSNLRYDLIFFDLDGTLADTMGDIRGNVYRVFREDGLALPDPETVHLAVGDGVRNLIHRCLPPGVEADEADLVRRFRQAYSDHLVEETVLFPGVREVLERLSAVRKVIVSNKPEGLSVRVLAEMGISGFFEAVYGGDTLAKGKPDPTALVETMQRFSVSPDRALMVGDSGVDLETGLAAGVDVVMVDYGYARPGDLDRAPWVISRFEELLGKVLPERGA